ncbi:MAG: SDR family oxidoreductase [Pseudomonadota bacterium]|nr:SDR family oxidoreductase [Pseudomonadota bacterium]
MARILLAGCGSIGTQLGLQLQNAGHQVWGLKRSPDTLPFPGLQGDLGQPLASTLLPPALDYVIHTGTPAERSDAGYRAGYPLAVQHLLDALGEQRLQRFIFVSSTAVYAQDDGSWVDETSATEPQAYNGRRVLEAERLVQASAQTATCVRFGGIYGPGRNWLLRRVQGGADVQVEPPKYTNRIHQDDCVGVLAHLLQLAEQRATLAECYLAVDDDPADEASVCSWLAQQLKAPQPTPNNPTDTPPAQNKRCRNQRLRNSGYAFQYPSFREGYQDVLRGQAESTH